MTAGVKARTVAAMLLRGVWGVVAQQFVQMIGHMRGTHCPACFKPFAEHDGPCPEWEEYLEWCEIK